MRTTMQGPTAMFWLISLVVLFTIGLQAPAAATEKDNLAVRGKVIAVNVKDSPNVILLRAMTGSRNQEVIVGATVHPEVEITRGVRRVRLHSIRVGEVVDLIYTKTLEGLVAQSIHVQ